VKFIPLALATVVITAAAAPSPSVFSEDKDFQVDLVVAMTNHSRSYCSGRMDAAITDLKVLIGVFETRLRKGVGQSDAKLIHGELIGLYGRLAKVYKAVGANDSARRATSNAIENWHLSDKDVDASTPQQVQKVVQEMDQREPCKRP
jgi:hypothetical protein